MDTRANATGALAPAPTPVPAPAGPLTQRGGAGSGGHRPQAAVLRRVVVAVAIATGIAPAVRAQKIGSTKHNLSTTGPGPIKATTEDRMCIFCHAPHRSSAQAPLWNHEDTRSTYIVYSSPTLKATPGQPTGTSRLCLSCHDGTIALGNIVSEQNQIQFQGGTVFLPPGHSMLDVNLSDDHPVSFPYDATLSAANPEIVAPGSLPADLPLDHNGEMQCSSCHDAHNNNYGDFLRRNPLFSQLCTGCHQKNGWTGSIHDQSAATWTGGGVDPWPHAPGGTVAENGCQNCHQPHEAGQPFHLLRYAQEENNCLVCHDGSVAGDVQGAFGLMSNHPITSQSGVHQPGEDPLTMLRHVECTDCHNPHAANLDNPPAPAADGALRFVDGIDVNGTPVASVAYGYEVCFKCHGDAHGSTPWVSRAINNLNTRQEFNPGAVSFHPVAAPGKNSSVPSLLPPYTTASLIECTDCHNSPTGFPGGTHGSNYPPLLKLKYNTQDFTRESSQEYALCYSCHNRNSILNDQSFKEHDKHVKGEDAPCATCHDSHGVSAGTGDPVRNAHLINFNTAIVQPSNSGKLYFEDQGTRKGRCYLKCHGKNHDPKGY